MAPCMMAMAIAIETFFSTCGACASAGEAARTDMDASAAIRTKRMWLVSLTVMVSRLVEPSGSRISPGRVHEIRGHRRNHCRFGSVLTTFDQAGFKPRQFGDQIGLDIADPHLD